MPGAKVPDLFCSVIHFICSNTSFDSNATEELDIDILRDAFPDEVENVSSGKEDLFKHLIETIAQNTGSVMQKSSD